MLATDKTCKRISKPSQKFAESEPARKKLSVQCGLHKVSVAPPDSENPSVVILVGASGTLSIAMVFSVTDDAGSNAGSLNSFAITAGDSELSSDGGAFLFRSPPAAL